MNISNYAEPARQVTATTSRQANERVRTDARNVVTPSGDCSIEAVPVSWRLDEARRFVKLAIDLQRDRKSRASGRYAKRALSLFAQESQTDDRDAIVARLCLADARFVRSDFARAETDYQDALSSIARLSAATPSLDIRNLRSQAIRGLANMALARGETLRAELELLRALDMAELTTASAHESSAMLMDDLGTLYRQTGRYDEAERIQHVALTFIEEAVGAEDPQTATILEHLALLEHACGRFAIGEQFARRAAAIQKRTFGRDHPRLANAFVVLASTLEGQGKLLEASQARQAAQLIALHWFGNDREALEESGLITATTQPRPDRRRSEGHLAGVGYA